MEKFIFLIHCSNFFFFHFTPSFFSSFFFSPLLLILVFLPGWVTLSSKSSTHCAPGRTSRRHLVVCSRPCDSCLTPPHWQLLVRITSIPPFQPIRKHLLQLLLLFWVRHRSPLNWPILWMSMRMTKRSSPVLWKSKELLLLQKLLWNMSRLMNLSRWFQILRPMANPRLWSQYLWLSCGSLIAAWCLSFWQLSFSIIGSRLTSKIPRSYYPSSNLVREEQHLTRRNLPFLITKTVGTNIYPFSFHLN